MRQNSPEMGLRTLQDTADFVAKTSRSRRAQDEHGINGGMRLSEEMLTPWNNDGFNREWMGRTSSLTSGRVCLGLYTAALITALSLVHVHIRFTIHDLRVHQRQYQVMHRQLSLKAGALERENARMGELPRLHDIAISRLQMEKPRHTEEAIVSPVVRARYLAPVKHVEDKAVRFAGREQSQVDRRLAQLGALINPE